VINAAAAGTWELGDLTVNRMGFGAMRLPGSLPSGESVPADRSRSIEVLRRAAGLGVNHIDTAAFYFSPLRSANELIAAALAPYPDDLVIVTKVGPGRDVVNLRRMRQESITEHFGALAQLRDAGLIRHLGVSDVTVTHLEEALAIAPVVCVQNRYALDQREHEAVLLACVERSIAFVPYFSLIGAGDARQAGAGAVRADPPELAEVARRLGATPPQVRLAWTLHHAPNVLAIPGTGDPAHLAENVAAAALRLTPEDLSLLDAVGR
jgi:aryl-alcohol dehydrogenase-like predicted oxidoreductase